MSSVRYLCDENLEAQLVTSLVKVEPAIDIHFVGESEEGIPPKGTTDPDLLLFAESSRFALLSWDKRSMPSHVANHRAQGHHMWGVFFLRPGFSIPTYVEALIYIWSSSEAEDWQDIIDWLP